MVTRPLSEAEIDAIYTALRAYNPENDPEGGPVVDREALREMEIVFEVLTDVSITYED